MKHTEKSQPAEVKMTVLDRKRGLEQYEGDESIYENILLNFVKTNQDTYMRLVGEIEQNHLKSAHRVAHSLRGAAGAIGAVRLADAAFSVENILECMKRLGCESLDENTLGENMSVLEKEFNAVFGELGYNEEKTEEFCDSGTEINRHEIVELLDKLAPLLECGDTKCLEYLDEVKIICSAAAEKFLLLIKQIENYDFEQADETLKEIRVFLTPIKGKRQER